MRPGFWIGSGSTAAVVFAVLASAALVAPAGFVRVALLAVASGVLLAPVAVVAVDQLRSTWRQRAERTPVPVLTAIVEPSADATLG